MSGTTVPRAALQPAVALTSKRALQLGIILLGTGLSVAAVLQTGGQAFVAIVLSVLVTLATVAALARRFGVPRDLAVLIAAGTAICGATAIMALAPLGLRPVRSVNRDGRGP